MMNSASGITDFNDWVYEEQEEESKAVEPVSSSCAQSVMAARTKAKMTQTDLAKKIGVKTSVIIAIENATGPYVGA